MAKAVARPIEIVDGAILREMFEAGTMWLESQVVAINALNVFPVPDGDTGTNMRLTMREALEKSREASPGAGVSEVADLIARGALMGARGNSGVILSQILRGFSRSVKGKDSIGGPEWAAAFQEASDSAYKALANPVEGTILTVVREVAEATRSMTAGDASLETVLGLACSTARWSVSRTTLMLDTLREHGVVDAGGQGLSVLLDGISQYLKGEVEPPPPMAPEAKPAAAFTVPFGADATQTYGFCTEFFVEDCKVDIDDLRARFEAMAESVIVVGEEGLTKIHLHTMQPDPIIAFAGSFGTVDRIKIENIDEQHEEFVERQAVAAAGEVGVVAVAAGGGLVALFRSLGAAVVPGGQTMNPSAEHIARAARELPWEDIIVLPNNKNVVLTAQQAGELAEGKTLHVVPTEDLPEGVAAMMAFNYEMDAGANTSAMDSARRSVKTGEITRAVRAAALEGKSVTKGQAIGLTGGALAVAEEDAESALESLADSIGVEEGSAVTVYYGEDVSPATAEEARRRLEKRFPFAEVQTYYGGQPHYHYLLSVE